MKRFCTMAAALAVCCAAATAASAQASIEALKAGSLPSSIRSGAAVPEIGRAAQISAYEAGEYRSAAEAKRALDAAVYGLRQSGLAVVGASVLPPAPERPGYALHIDYQDGVGLPGSAPRTVEAYTSAEYPSMGAARSGLSASVDSLVGSGYAVLRTQVLARGARWVYQVDYVRGRQTPLRRPQLITSGYYLQAYSALALRDMNLAIYSLRRSGKVVLAWGVFPVWGTPYCVYQVQYLAP
ncbi:MAG: hypothetical protein HYV15_07280 [Elusimicrobia bacterium]|nr:hypothetical protein [Elusimicrobiota bacterium]